MDKELDFSEATLVAIQRDGYRYEPFPFPVSFSRTWARTRVEHSIDFDTPGIYRVDVYRVIWGEDTPDYVITFFIQVIDDEIFNKLKTGMK